MNKERDTYMYHQLKAPKGEVFNHSEVPFLERKGWVDTPAKFGKGIRGKWYNFIIFCRTTLKQFWLDHWKWIITTAIAIATLCFSLILMKK